MSWCRWSTDDYQCDVYVYESTSGFETHVAGRHPVFTEPLPEPVPFTVDTIPQWMERNRLVMDLLDRTEHVDIDLPGAGESFVDDTPGECADRLAGLKELGFWVPQRVIDALRAEAADAATRRE